MTELTKEDKKHLARVDQIIKESTTEGPVVHLDPKVAWALGFMKGLIERLTSAAR